MRLPDKVVLNVYTANGDQLCHILADLAWTADMLKEAVASHAGEGKCLCDLLVGGRYFDDAGTTLATLGLEPNTGMTPVEAVVQKLVEPGTYECEWVEKFMEPVTYSCKLTISADFTFVLEQRASFDEEAAISEPGKVKYGNKFVFNAVDPVHAIRCDEEARLYLSTGCCRTADDELLFVRKVEPKTNAGEEAEDCEAEEEKADAGDDVPNWESYLDSRGT